jgi:uncharacterized tellurite resistance protein B-like protein
MTYQTTLINLYYLLIHADGVVDEREIATGHQLVAFEGLSDREFDRQMELLKSKSKDVVLEESIAGLKKLERIHQIRCIAWLCVAANADGFMDRSEWQFIYKLYHKQLNLPLDEILALQKELSRLFRQKSFSSPTIL